MASPLRVPLLLLAILAVTLAVTLAKTVAKGSKRVGGIEEADVNDEEVQQALDFAIRKYNEESNDVYYSGVRQVVRARQQVVAGMNYFFDVKIGRTTCAKSQPNLDNCPFHEQQRLRRERLCSFEIYSVPWEDSMTLVKSSCQKA
ncbi:cystatin-C-like [Eulemur rufifrons]|uniref:cystatin-C-like n=1 Tax=Eulemur rufifrons TaxID=859984 RepID=UPI00374492AF